ncbi:MAG: 2Fe-2S iron-sulfur cluster-binding protein, partial [Candidatus Poseidoniaceae archaeon]
PGFLISAQALLEHTSSPTEAQVNEAIEGNLCRCTGYQPIVESIMAAAALLRGEGETPAPSTDPHADPHPSGPEEPQLPPGHAR